MSSVVSSKKYKIALFQGGFGDDGHGFDETINLMKKSNSSFLAFSSTIDMSHFNPSENCFYGNISGYYTNSTKATNDF